MAFCATRRGPRASSCSNMTLPILHLGIGHGSCPHVSLRHRRLLDRALGAGLRDSRQLVVMSPLMMSPNNSHFSPLNRIICSSDSGAKSVAEVLILTPGISVSGVKSL